MIVTNLRAEGAGTGTLAQVFREAGVTPHATAPSAAEQVAARIAELTLSMPEGQRIGSKAELREWSSVSVGTFNEAMRLLQAHGNVTLKRGPNGGVFTARPTPIQRLAGAVFAQHIEEPSLSEAFLIRSALDVLIVRDVAAAAGPEVIAALRADVAEMNGAVTNRDVSQFALANCRFHAHLCDACGIGMLRPFYMALLDIIVSRTSAASTADEAMVLRIRERVDKHTAIVDAIAAGDVAAAEAAMTGHNNSSWIQGMGHRTAVETTTRRIGP